MAQEKPNVLFSLADEWGMHAGAYGDKVVETPVFDQLALEEVGYFVGRTRKGYGPGHLGEREPNPAEVKFDDYLYTGWGPQYKEYKKYLNKDR